MTHRPHSILARHCGVCATKVVLLLVLSLPSSNSFAANWAFKTTEEDWGLTCFAETNLGTTGKLGLYGATGGNIVAYLSLEGNLLPNSGNIILRFDNGETTKVEGGTSDYFGHYELDTSDVLIDQLADSMTVSVSGGNMKPVVFSLSGSDATIAKVRRCVD